MVIQPDEYGGDIWMLYIKALRISCRVYESIQITKRFLINPKSCLNAFPLHLEKFVLGIKSRDSLICNVVTLSRCSPFLTEWYRHLVTSLLSLSIEVPASIKPTLLHSAASHR